MNYRDLAIQLYQTGMKIHKRVERRKAALRKFSLLSRIFFYPRFNNSRLKIKELESARFNVVAMMIGASRTANRIARKQRRLANGQSND